MKTMFTKICMFAIKEEGLQLVKRVIALPPYNREDELNAFLGSAARDLTAKDFREAGFEELVDGERMAAVGVSYTKMGDEATCYYYKHGFLPIEEHVAQQRAKTIVNDVRYQDVFEFCLDDDKGTYSERRETDIQKGIDTYKELYEKIGKRINGQDYGVERIDDHVLKDGILRSLVCIYDRTFIQITMNLSNKGQIRYTPATYYDVKYNISMIPFGNDILNFLHDNGKYQHDYVRREDWDEKLDKVFLLPADFAKRQEAVRRKVKKHFRKEISADDIAYDRMNGCYYLRNEVSDEILKAFIPERSKEQFVGKYTTMGTLFEILKSGKIRLNSIISMNDKTETSFLTDLMKNYDEPTETTELATIRANSTHIISFSTNTDNLDMWRWYGDDGKGVCMVFERDVTKDEYVMSVAYVDAALQKQIDKVKRFLSDLKEERVDFRFHLLEDYRHYIKPKEYKPEGECRMIVKTGHHDGWFVHSENGIMTPYIDAKLVNMVNCEIEGVFPYKLSKVILGPKFREGGINKTQIRMMCMDRGWWDVEIVESEIKSYR